MLNDIMIEKYRKNIENLFKETQYDRIEKLDEVIKNILDNAFKNNTISEDEYDLLNDFLEEQLKRELNSSMLNKFKIENFYPTITDKEQLNGEKNTDSIEKEGEER